MGEAKQQQVVKSPCLPTNCHAKYEDHWETIKGEGEGEGEGCVCILSSQENSSIDSIGSNSSSSDMADDASSPTSSSCSSSSSNSASPLFELADLMANLPIKRGLSKYYEGKSQSFTSLSNVSCIEDMVKKGVPYRRKLKASRSYANGLDLHKPYTLPKAIISKKVSRRGSVTSLSYPSGRNCFLTSTRPPVVPVQKKF